MEIVKIFSKLQCGPKLIITRNFEATFSRHTYIYIFHFSNFVLLVFIRGKLVNSKTEMHILPIIIKQNNCYGITEPDNFIMTLWRQRLIKNQGALGISARGQGP